MPHRLAHAKYLCVPLVGAALVTGHAWPEGGVTDHLLAGIGFSLLVLAMTGRIWCGAHIAGRKTRDLVTDGPYSICRNPLYFFSLIGFIGAGLSFESLTLAVAFAGVFMLTHLPTIRAEERNLRTIYGESFDAYARTVPRLIPSMRTYHQDAHHMIGTVAFNRILREASLLPLIYLLAQGVELAQLKEVLPVWWTAY